MTIDGTLDPENECISALRYTGTGPSSNTAQHLRTLEFLTRDYLV